MFRFAAMTAMVAAAVSAVMQGMAYMFCRFVGFVMMQTIKQQSADDGCCDAGNNG